MTWSITENFKIEATQQELLLIMSDQLFRRKFIDPKMSGYKADPAELAMGKEFALRDCGGFSKNCWKGILDRRGARQESPPAHPDLLRSVSAGSMEEED
jgi:hypothetical protein